MKRLRIAIVACTAAATLGTASITGLSSVNAATSGDSLIERLASRFNLNKDDVQKVFDEHRDEMRAEHQKYVSERLQDKVDNGSITAEQKTLIENKMNEREEKHEEERKTLEAWAKENNIDLRYVRFGMGPKIHDRLDDTVDDGELTAEQQKLLKAKKDELREKRKAGRDALQAWAKENNIDLKDIMFHVKVEWGRGPGFHGHIL